MVCHVIDDVDVFSPYYEAADRFSINKSWDHIQSKFVGTGHSDMTKFEWASNQHRDTIASHIGHHDMLSFFAIAQNDSIGRVRYQLLEVRIDSDFHIYILFRLNRKCSNHVAHLQLARMTIKHNY
jgi:splicing factor 3B subunit 5